MNIAFMALAFAVAATAATARLAAPVAAEPAPMLQEAPCALHERLHADRERLRK